MDFPPKVNRQLDRSPTSFPLNAPGYYDDENYDDNDEDNGDNTGANNDNYPPCPLAECPLQAPFTCWFAATGAPLTMGGVCASIRDDFKGNVHNDCHMTEINDDMMIFSPV